MAIEYLKTGKSQADRAEDDQRTRAVPPVTMPFSKWRGASSGPSRHWSPIG